MRGRYYLLHVLEEEGHVVGGGLVLEHVVESPLTRAACFVLRLWEIFVQQVPDGGVGHHLVILTNQKTVLVLLANQRRVLTWYLEFRQR